MDGLIECPDAGAFLKVFKKPSAQLVSESERADGVVLPTVIDLEGGVAVPERGLEQANFLPTQFEK